MILIVARALVIQKENPVYISYGEYHHTCTVVILSLMLLSNRLLLKKYRVPQDDPSESYITLMIID